MKRTAILIIALLALVAASAHAAFPGRNGAIVYGYSSGSYGWDDQLGDDRELRREQHPHADGAI